MAPELDLRRKPGQSGNIDATEGLRQKFIDRARDIFQRAGIELPRAALIDGTVVPDPDQETEWDRWYGVLQDIVVRNGFDIPDDLQ